MLSTCNFSKFYFQGTGDVDGSILNKGHNDEFHGSSGGKNCFHLPYCVLWCFEHL